MNNKYLTAAKKTAYALIAIFVSLLTYFLISLAQEVKRTYFLGVAILGISFFILGGLLIFLTFKSKVKGKPKLFLLMAGFSAPGVLVFTILHNCFYALATITNITFLKQLLEFLHASSFIISLVICPIAFLVGIIGSIWLLKKR